MAKRTSVYASMSASDLSRVTRERGLSKPEGMINISEWADFLEAEDAKAAGRPTPNEVAKAEAKAAAAEPIAEHGTEANAIKTFEDMTVPELKAYADQNEIDLGGATKRDDILAALEAKG